MQRLVVPDDTRRIRPCISEWTTAKKWRASSYLTVRLTFSPSSEMTLIEMPLGTVIFACHKVHPSTRPLNPNEAGPTSSQHYPSQVNPQYYDHASHSYSLPPVPAPSSYQNGFPPPPPHHSSSHYSSGGWSHNPESPSSPAHYTQWNSHGSGLSSAPSVSSVRSSSYPAPPQQQWPSQPPSYLEASSAAPPPLAQSGGPSGSPYPPPLGGNDETPPSPGSDYVPPSRVTHRRGSNTREQYGNGGRSTGSPPVGITRCSSCKVTHSPEWRKGPSGKKDLCNASVHHHVSPCHFG